MTLILTSDLDLLVKGHFSKFSVIGLTLNYSAHYHYNSTVEVRLNLS